MKTKYSKLLISTIAAASIGSACADLSSVFEVPVEFTILGRSGMTFTNSVVEGDVGVIPGGAFTQTDSSIIGSLHVNGSAVTFTNSIVEGDVGADIAGPFTQTESIITGEVYPDDFAAQWGYDRFLSNYEVIKAEPATVDLTGQILSGKFLPPGVYSFDAAVTETDGLLTLVGSATDTWVFKVGTKGTGALTGTGFTVVMANEESSPANVIWWTAEAATLTDSKFIGSIYAGSSITVTRGSLNGKALAESAVTLTGTGIVGFNSNFGGEIQ